MLEKNVESPLNCNEIKPANPKANQCWIFMGRTHAEAPILWPSDPKSPIFGKDRDAGKHWRQEEKRTTEYKMVGWHNRLCCSPEGLQRPGQELTTEQQEQQGFGHMQSAGLFPRDLGLEPGHAQSCDRLLRPDVMQDLWLLGKLTRHMEHPLVTDLCSRGDGLASEVTVTQVWAWGEFQAQSSNLKVTSKYMAIESILLEVSGKEGIKMST